jgi:hypothetical protein
VHPQPYEQRLGIYLDGAAGKVEWWLTVCYLIDPKKSIQHESVKQHNCTYSSFSMANIFLPSSINEFHISVGTLLLKAYMDIMQDSDNNEKENS